MAAEEAYLWSFSLLFLLRVTNRVLLQFRNIEENLEELRLLLVSS